MVSGCTPTHRATTPIVQEEGSGKARGLGGVVRRVGRRSTGGRGVSNGPREGTSREHGAVDGGYEVLESGVFAVLVYDGVQGPGTLLVEVLVERESAPLGPRGIDGSGTDELGQFLPSNHRTVKQRPKERHIGLDTDLYSVELVR